MSQSQPEEATHRPRGISFTSEDFSQLGLISTSPCKAGRQEVGTGSFSMQLSGRLQHRVGS